MRRKENRVIKPVGSELMDYLNKGYAICNKCGAVMDRREDPKGGCDIYTCPSCGWEIDEMDYEYEDGDEMELVLDERGKNCLIFRNDMPPAGCRTCGGPYPYCKASCKINVEEESQQGLFLFLFGGGHAIPLRKTRNLSIDVWETVHLQSSGV